MSFCCIKNHSVFEFRKQTRHLTWMWFCPPTLIKRLAFRLFRSPGSPLPNFTSSKVTHQHRARGRAWGRSYIETRQYKSNYIHLEECYFFQRKEKLLQVGLKPVPYCIPCSCSTNWAYWGSSAGQVKSLKVINARAKASPQLTRF